MKFSEIHIRDPFILPFEGTYYMYGTRGANAWETTTTLGFDVYESRDLENWSAPVPCFEPDLSFWGTKNFWAPEVHIYKGKFYMFASFKSETDRRGTQIFVADSPKGPFREHSEKAITPHDWECLDGTLYVAKNGTPYIVFCHEWSQVTDGEMCALQLTDDLKNTVGKPRLLFHASEPAWSKNVADTDGFVTDGPYPYRNSDGKLFLLWSSFSESGYVQAVATSSNDDIDGNWTHSHPLLLDRDGGHGMLFQAFEGGLNLILHRPNNTPMERPVLFEVTDSGSELKIK